MNVFYNIRKRQVRINKSRGVLSILNIKHKFNQLILERKKAFDLLGYIIIIELVLGGSGRLLSVGSFITLRYVLYFAALCYYGMVKVFKIGEKDKNIFYDVVYIFFFFFIISLINGLLKGHPISLIITSSKGFLYLLMIFPLTFFIDDSKKVDNVVKIFTSSCVVLAVLSIFMFIIFSLIPSSYNSINPLLLKLDYGFLSIRYGLPSIFFKTSPYVAIAFIIELFIYSNIKEKRNVHSLIKIFILFLGCVITMTIGIWIAVIFGVFLTVVFSKGKQKKVLIMIIIFTGLVVLFFFSEYIIQTIFNRVNINDRSFIIKFNQLSTLLEVWKNNIIFGSGFGKSIVFNIGQDVRQMEIFELFWIGLLVNMGIAGLLSFVYMILKVMIKAYQLSTETIYYHSILIKALIIGLVQMCIISSVNPFLNNPIGIGYLLIVMLSVNAHYNNKGNRCNIQL